MTFQGISEEVDRFIVSHIHSVEQLEILLLLRRRADQAWTATMVVNELRSAHESVVQRLADLESRGLLSVSGSDERQYTYKPQDPGMDRAIEGLDRAYSERRFAVIDRIFSKPVDHIKTFSDAFKFKKDR